MREEDYDEVDRFHKSANKLSLRVDDDDDGGFGEEEDDLPAAVLDLDDDEEEDDEDDDDEDDEDDEALQQMRRAKQTLKSKLLRDRAAAADVGAPSNSDEEELAAAAGWGKRKQAYYDDGDYEVCVDARRPSACTQPQLPDACVFSVFAQDASDEEAAQEEEKEALRLQRKAAQALRADDFDDTGEGEDAEPVEREEPDARGRRPDASRRGRLPAAGQLAASRGAVVEALHNGNDEGAALAAAEDGAPELVALAGELQTALEEVRTRAGPLTDAVRRGEFATKDGISYLDAKHLTLLSYCMNIVFYILLKARASSSVAGERVRDHPVVKRLLEARTYLEKARPIDKKMAYQLDRLLKMASSAGAADHAVGSHGDDEGGGAGFVDADDPMHLRPNVDALLSSRQRGAARADGEAEAGGDGVYRPPRLVPTRMGADGGGDDDDEPGARGAKRAARAEAERRRRAARSALVMQLNEELTGAPTLVTSDLAAGGGAAAEDVGFIRREAARLARRAAQEEELFARVPMSKQERQRARAAERKSTGMTAQVADFADDVADVVTAVERLEHAGAARGATASDMPALPATKKVKLSAIAAAAAVTANNAAQRTPLSGDADLPKRLELGERRSAFERRPRPGAAAAGPAGDDDDMDVGFDDDDNPHFGGGPKAAPKCRSATAAEEDGDVYTAALTAAETKRARKRQMYDPAERFAPVYASEEPQAEAEERRGITGAMWSNRGLTPHRNKDKKNPRKKHRIAYADALVRRKGAVRDAASGPVAGGLGYGGEATGIKSTVVKSRRL